MLNLKNTLDGYLKNVEVIGNTIQDANNLADIRSVGDKVEGQELYKIGIISHGANIFKGNYEKDKYMASNGLVTNSTDWCATDFIECNPNTTYTQNFNIKLSPIVYCCFYDKNKNLISAVNANSFTTPSNCRYIRTSWKYSVYGFDFQIEEGTQATPYEPYKENKLEILSPVQLEKVGDVADRIICKDGVWGVEKNVSNEVFTVDDISTVTFLGNVVRYVFRPRTGLVLNRNAISNYTNNFYIDFAYDGESWYETGGTVVVKRSKATVGDTEEKAKEYLKNNPIVFLNTTTQPTFIPLPHDQQVKLRTFAGQTNIAFLTEIPGQIKAQVPKSLGATVNTHTEQIADLHNSLERVKKLEETTVSTVETESNFTTVDATSNGYFEDVKLEGKTLANLMAGTKTHFNGSEIIVVNYNPNMLKPSTEYTVYLLDQNQSFKTDVFYASSNMVTSTHRGDVTKPIKLVTKYNINIDVKGFYYYLKSEFAGDSSKVPSNLRVLLLEGDYTNNPPEFFEGLMSVGQDVEEVSVESRNSDETQLNKKPLLYYNPTTETWEKPVLREWDTIEKHSDGKYYYHKRSEEVVLNGSENWGWAHVSSSDSANVISFNTRLEINPDTQKYVSICNNFTNIHSFGVDADFENFFHANPNYTQFRVLKSKLSTQDEAGFKAWLKANPTTVVYQLAQEEVYECTNIDLMTYSGETNYIINSGAISPKSLLKVHNNISNVVKILQEKVSLLENTFIAGLKSVLSGDMYSLATILYPEDFEQTDNIEQDIMVIPE